MVHISHPYRTTCRTSVLTNLFLRSTLILLVSSSFLLLNASFAIPILVLTSSKHLPSSEIKEPRYLNSPVHINNKQIKIKHTKYVIKSLIVYVFEYYE